MRKEGMQGKEEGGHEKGRSRGMAEKRKSGEEMGGKTGEPGEGMEKGEKVHRVTCRHPLPMSNHNTGAKTVSVKVE